MLAEFELELVKNGCKNINVEAHKRFQHRSLEAIKCHRRQKENSLDTSGAGVNEIICSK